MLSSDADHVSQSPSAHRTLNSHTHGRFDLAGWNISSRGPAVNVLTRMWVTFRLSVGFHLPYAGDCGKAGSSRAGRIREASLPGVGSAAVDSQAPPVDHRSGAAVDQADHGVGVRVRAVRLSKDYGFAER